MNTSLAREKSYVILAGLERSLGDCIVRNFDLQAPHFLTEDEEARAYGRLRDDQGDQNVGPGDLYVEDLLPYLDLGDLVGILNRHAERAQNVLPEHVRAATAAILKGEALAIRKRVMHPIRPLEVDDYPKLLRLSALIQKESPSLSWDPLAIGLRRLKRESGLIDVRIPPFWADEASITHNLPPAEFDDTGFIGRTRERKELRRLLESDHRVVTVAGGAGVGKTALTLRVCNDLLEDPKTPFERIVWVTLKTRHLTSEGIREIHEAVDSLGSLIDSVLKSLKANNRLALSSSPESRWGVVLDQLKTSKTLLVIDNLETVGDEARELVVNVPPHSKIVFTSRVGLGEIEIRYPLSGFASTDAAVFLRSLVAIHNCAPLRALSPKGVGRYVSTLGCNPLLIKWFVLAVCRGADPGELLTKSSLAEPLGFFYDSIYERLNISARQILATLMASRRELTRAQLQDLTGMQYVPFLQATQDLVRTSMIERIPTSEGITVFRMGQLVSEYLSASYPPDDALVRMVRERIRIWQVEQDKSATDTARYRYGPHVLDVNTADERIAAQHLLRAIKAIDSNDLESASSALATAEQVAPTWWEVYRVKARLSEALNKPIYEVEEAYEQAIRMADNDVVRYHYATFLLRHNELERTLEQVEKGREFESALPTTFRSLKGLALMRKGQIPEAISELQEVWSSRTDDLPTHVGRTQGTQLADAHRRHAEQMLSLGKDPEAIQSCVRGAKVVDEAMADYGCDDRLAETAVNIVSSVAGHAERPDAVQAALAGLTARWDTSSEFRRHVIGYQKAVEHFQRNPRLQSLFPAIAGELQGLGFVRKYTGTVLYTVPKRGFGIIHCAELGRIYFDQTSLVDRGVWSMIGSGDALVFAVVVPRRTDLLPRAVDAELNTTMKLHSRS